MLSIVQGLLLTTVRGNDDCDIPGTAEMCTNETYARLWFILEACKDFHDHLQSVLDALHYGRTHVGNKQAKWVETFTKDREDVMSAVGRMLL